MTADQVLDAIKNDGQIHAMTIFRRLSGKSVSAKERQLNAIYRDLASVIRIIPNGYNAKLVLR